MPDEESQQTASPEDPVAVESSPARSYRSSTNSSIRGGGGKWFKSLEGSPSKSWGGMIDGVFGASGAGTSLGSGGVGTGGSETPMSNKKMLKIGANVRFRGDVMECNTLVLCGRLQVRCFCCLSERGLLMHNSRGSSTLSSIGRYP